MTTGTKRPKYGPNPPGRPKGTPNKLTLAAKQAFEYAFDAIGGPQALASWASSNNRNRAMFYRLYARLIPLSVNVDSTVRMLSYAEERSRELSSDAADAADATGSAPPNTLQ